MREAIGATWIFGIVIVFIFIFTSYLAFSINFSKAFGMKDEIIDVLEKHEGPGFKDGPDTLSSDALREISSYMNEVNYRSKGNCYTTIKHLYGVGRAGGMEEDRFEDYKLKTIMGVTREYAHLYTDLEFKTGSYNYCVIRESQTGSGNDAYLSFSSYRVLAFFSIDIGQLSMLSSYYVSGETKNITYPHDDFLEEDRTS